METVTITLGNLTEQEISSLIENKTSKLNTKYFYLKHYQISLI